MKKQLLLLVFVLVSFGFTDQAINASYVGSDEYSNQLISLQLNADNTYLYKENFLDGSELVDKGEWSRNKEILILESSRKTKRVHQSQNFKKSYKFRGEKFLMKADGLEYMWTNKRNVNQYLMKYTVRRVN